MVGFECVGGAANEESFGLGKRLEVFQVDVIRGLSS